MAISVAARKRAEDPEWQANQFVGAQKRSADPEWYPAILEGARKRVEDPEWRANQSEGARKRSADPEWPSKNAESRRLANIACSAKALAKDALCTPEETAKRVRLRENSRRSKTKKRLRATETG